MVALFQRVGTDANGREPGFLFDDAANSGMGGGDRYNHCAGECIAVMASAASVGAE